MRKLFNVVFFLIVFAFFIPSAILAHEAYVLPTQTFWTMLHTPFDPRAFQALNDPHNLSLTLMITAGVITVYLLNFAFRLSKLGERVHRAIESIRFLGPIFVRIAISASFFASALSWSFLGPELSLHSLPVPGLLRSVLFAASAMIAFGLFTELAGLISLIIFTFGFAFFGIYLFTYFNYLGEIIVLFLFGMRKWSLDGLLFGPKNWLAKYNHHTTTIVRMCYGFALMYAAITVKFLHPDMTMKVVNDWHLTQFHWLFPSDPLLVVLGAGLAEFAIGFFIFLGFEMRLTVAISLFYITLSLLYFRELVWPHLMLYGISLDLVIQPETFTLDHLFFAEKRRGWWKRILKPHLPGALK